MAFCSFFANFSQTILLPLIGALCEYPMGLDTVEFVIKIEEEFDLSIPDVGLEHLGVVGDFVIYVVNACEMQNGVILEFEFVYERFKSTLHKDYDIPIKLIHLKSHVVKDLGMD